MLVRPGAAVTRHEVLATLDCRSASASSQAVAAEARAIDAQHQAALHESARLDSLLDGGFVSPNEAEQKQALSTSEEAKLASQRAMLTSTSLAVDDCVLRSPFDGEVATLLRIKHAGVLGLVAALELLHRGDQAVAELAVDQAVVVAAPDQVGL